MKQALVKIAFRSLIHYRKETIYQVIIISILAAIISGSLLTGHSVRSSLNRTLSEKLGNAELLISSGLRYFDASLADRFTAKSGAKSVAIIETRGYCQNFSTGATALNTNIYWVNNDFFPFQGSAVPGIEKGSIYINKSLSRKLDLKTGDEVILHFEEITPFPPGAPFSPSDAATGSKVLRVAAILSGQEAGNFSLGTSQADQLNIFVNPEDLAGDKVKQTKANRLLIRSYKGYDSPSLFRILSDVIIPGDLGLSVRISPRTGEAEMISDRIFIDSAITEEIIRLIPLSSPVITYLANSFRVKTKTTPYSFVSALPATLYSDIGEDEIIINRWLAEDLEAKTADTLKMEWFNPGTGKMLQEKSRSFVIKSIAENDFRYSDSTLMPDFPGISGSATCSGWDAGVPVKMDRIRKKDEAYWNRYRGTPKAFISYETGKRLWGNNFGPATALRFPSGMDTSAIMKRLSGNLDTAKGGLTISDLRTKNRKAASDGVDFGMLFLSLSIFIILSCIILLSMSLSLFLDSRKDQIKTCHALGFSNRKVFLLVFYETLFISFIGSLIGILLGYLVDILFIKALNSVWEGAVQTNALSPGLSIIPLLAGFITTIFISTMLVRIRLKSFLSGLAGSPTGMFKPHSSRQNLIFLIVSFLIAAFVLVLSAIFRNHATILAFAGGSLLLIAMVLALRQYYIGKSFRTGTNRMNYSRFYYASYPSHAVTPVIFLAAGIFALIITGSNRQVITDKMLQPAGGTGGYLLWAESAVPVRENLNSQEGKAALGFDEKEFKEISFVQAKRLQGDDASCLNISHITSPPILGIDPGAFMNKASFSFSTRVKEAKDINPWNILNESPAGYIIYGIADQTVLQWGLKIKTGDTLKYLAENGQPLNIIIGAGLKSSLFQGYLLIGEKSFERYFPSAGGSSVFLVDGDKLKSDLYANAINERLSGYGISVEPAREKLASFFQVTNTYIDVFMMLGALGLILGAAGLGFILIRNFNSRKREFALMTAAGYTARRIKKLLLKDHIIILVWGLFTGLASALSASWPSIKSGSDLPWILLLIMLVLTFAIGLFTLLISVNQIKKENLISELRKE
jgi:ABC-type antimicrobial peptide transport system permease subunit